MSIADMVSILYSMTDQMGPAVTKFFTDPDDYIDAIMQSMRYHLMEAVMHKEWWNVPKNIIYESATDGNALANDCELLLSAWDATGGNWCTVLSPQEFAELENVDLPGTAYCTVSSTAAGNNIFQTIPASGTFNIFYMRPSAQVDVNIPTDCEFSSVVHPRVVQDALMILISRDPDSPVMEQIETYRDQLSKFRFEKFPDSPYIPAVIPYQQPR